MKDTIHKCEFVQGGETYAVTLDLMQLKFRIDELAVAHQGQPNEVSAITSGLAAYITELANQDGFTCSAGSAYQMLTVVDEFFADLKKNTETTPG